MGTPGTSRRLETVSAQSLGMPLQAFHIPNANADRQCYGERSEATLATVPNLDYQVTSSHETQHIFKRDCSNIYWVCPPYVARPSCNGGCRQLSGWRRTSPMPSLECRLPGANARSCNTTVHQSTSESIIMQSADITTYPSYNPSCICGVITSATR